MAEAWTTALDRGWGITQTKPEEAAFYVKYRGGEVVEASGDESSTSALRPTRQLTPFERQLGPKKPYDPEMFHTAYAHLPQPPDVVLFLLDGAGPFKVRVWNTAHLREITFPAEEMNNGQFVVGGGPSAFLAAARNPSTGALRYNPLSMMPADRLSQVSADFFSSLGPYSTALTLDGPNACLILDNRFTMHTVIEDQDHKPVEPAVGAYYLRDGQ